MNTGSVQSHFAFRQAQETGTLFVSLGPQFGHLQKFLSGGESAIFFSVFQDIFRHRAVDACHIGKQGRTCCVQIYTHAVYTVFHHAAEGFAQTLLVHVMLILTDTDGFGVDLHQFRQGVLNTSADGNGTAEGNIIFWEFLRPQLGCRINGCPRFIGNDILYFTFCFLQHFCHKQFGFPGGRAVADGNEVNAVFLDEAQQLLFRFSGFILGWRGVNHGRFQRFACGIDDSNFAACAIGRVKGQHHLAADGRLQKELLQIFTEDADGRFFRFFRQVISDLSFQRGSDQSFIAVRNNFSENFRRIAVFADDLPFHPLQQFIFFPFNFHGKEAFLFSAVHRKDAMTCRFFQWLLIIIIHFINRRFLLGFFGKEGPILHRCFTEGLSQVGIIGNLLCQNILRPLHGIGNGFHTFFHIHKSRRKIFQCTDQLLPPDHICQGLQPFFLCNGGTGAAFGAEGTINIVDLCLGFRCIQFRRQFIGQVALFGNGIFHLLPLFLQIAESSQPFGKLTDNLIIQRTGHFLTVTSDKRNGVALV